MNIAMVAPSQVDAYLDRVDRFIAGVNALKDRVNEMLAARTPANEKPVQITADEPVSVKPEAAASYTPEPAPAPAQNVSPVMGTKTEPAMAEPVGKTPDDIDLDKIMSEISLGDGLMP